MTTLHDEPVTRKAASLVAQVVAILLSCVLAAGGAYLALRQDVSARPSRDEVATLGDARWCARTDCASIMERVASTDRMLTKLGDDMTEIKADMRSMRESLTDILRAARGR